MENVVAIVNEKPAKKAPARRYSKFAEDPTAQYLLMGTDQRGKTVYYFKVQVTGLQERMFGPYGRRSKAIECFDEVLDGALESFITAENEGRTTNSGRECVVLPQNLAPVPVR